MQNAYLEKFEEWWAKTTFKSTRGWSRDGERKFEPCSPRKLAQTAWNAAFHLMLRQANARAREATEFANKRVLAMQRRLEQAQCEIDVLERTAPIPDSEFEQRLVMARNALLSAKIRELGGNAAASVAPPSHEALRCAIEAAEIADAARTKAESERDAALRAHSEWTATVRQTLLNAAALIEALEGPTAYSVEPDNGETPAQLQWIAVGL